MTPLGALAVVVSAIGSSVFLRERLSFVGKVSCGLCILGAAIIVVNAPSTKSATTIQDMQHYVVAPGFLSYAGIIIVLCIFLAFWAGPRYGKRVILFGLCHGVCLRARLCLCIFQCELWSLRSLGC